MEPKDGTAGTRVVKSNSDVNTMLYERIARAAVVGDAQERAEFCARIESAKRRRP